jgi:hypothetical protein
LLVKLTVAITFVPLTAKLTPCTKPPLVPLPVKRRLEMGVSGEEICKVRFVDVFNGVTSAGIDPTVGETGAVTFSRKLWLRFVIPSLTVISTIAVPVLFCPRLRIAVAVVAVFATLTPVTNGGLF